MTLKLTTEQQEAANKFSQFLLDKNHNEFYLFGAAGCGKTFLTRHFIESLVPAYYKTCKILNTTPCFNSIELTATTNKAVEVLLQQGISKISPKTIFSLFKVIVNENHTTGSTYLKEVSSDPVENKLIFIDECSMLPSKMLNIIRYRGRGCKIVFIGDRYQLAPVKEKPHWDNTYEPYTIQLKTPVRNKNSKALIDLCNQLRTTVETGEFKDISLVPGSIEQADDETAQKWLLSSDYEFNKVLCYTNSKVLMYQEWVHKNLYNKSELIEKDQLYLNNSNFEIGSKSKVVKRLYPEELVKVISVNPNIQTSKFGKYSIPTYSVDLSSKSVSGKVWTDLKVPLNIDHWKALLKEAYKNKDFEDYFNMKNRLMDLRLPYACTVHKSQGNSYDEVFIDLDSFKYCRDPSVAARLLYVAVSRARNKVYFYGSLPKKYGALI